MLDTAPVWMPQEIVRDFPSGSLASAAICSSPLAATHHQADESVHPCSGVGLRKDEHGCTTGPCTCGTFAVSARPERAATGQAEAVVLLLPTYMRTCQWFSLSLVA
jgi:uncharacterized membrane protein